MFEHTFKCLISEIEIWDYLLVGWLQKLKTILTRVLSLKQLMCIPSWNKLVFIEAVRVVHIHGFNPSEISSITSCYCSIFIFVVVFGNCLFILLVDLLS